MPMAVANRYARALADVVSPTGDYRGVLKELQDFAAAYRASAELRELLESPAVPLPEKTKVLDAILARLKASKFTGNFLRVLLSHYRMGMMEEAVQAFRRTANVRMGIVEVKVFSASDLSEADLRALRAGFQQLTQHQVELEFHLDRDLLGGILAQIGSTVFDGTLRGQLERMREQLTAR